MTQRKPTSDTGGIAAIDSGEYTPTIDLKAHHSRGALLFPKTLYRCGGRFTSRPNSARSTPGRVST